MHGWGGRQAQIIKAKLIENTNIEWHVSLWWCLSIEFARPRRPQTWDLKSHIQNLTLSRVGI